MENPYRLTPEEQNMMKEDWKKPRKKKKTKVNPGPRRGSETEKMHLKPTVSSRHKQKVSEELLQFL